MTLNKVKNFFVLFLSLHRDQPQVSELKKEVVKIKIVKSLWVENTTELSKIFFQITKKTEPFPIPSRLKTVPNPWDCENNFSHSHDSFRKDYFSFSSSKKIRDFRSLFFGKKLWWDVWKSLAQFEFGPMGAPRLSRDTTIEPNQHSHAYDQQRSLGKNATFFTLSYDKFINLLMRINNEKLKLTIRVTRFWYWCFQLRKINES